MSGDVEQNPGPVNFDKFSTSELKEILQWIDNHIPDTRDLLLKALNARDQTSVNLAVNAVQQQYQLANLTRNSLGETSIGTHPCEMSNVENICAQFDSISGNYVTSSTESLKESVTTDKHPNETSMFRSEMNDSTVRSETDLNIDKAIKFGLDALNDLGIGSFGSGVQFCPPHFVEHKFFTEEMALAYRSGNFGDGPLREFGGKMWEERIYHGLMENLPHLLETTSIQSMWVFSGLCFALNSELLTQLSINVREETEIDLLVVVLTKTGNLFLIPIEIKKVKSDGSVDILKASNQCRKYSERLSDVLKLVLQRNDVEHFIQPVICCCNNYEPSVEQKSTKNFWKRFKRRNQPPVDNGDKKVSEICMDKLPKTFQVYLSKYEQFKFNTQSNFFSWISQIAYESQKKNCDSSEYQQLIGLLVFILSCKITKHNKHDTTCYKHIEIGGKGICMKGTMLCSKYIHEYIVKNIDFLTYLRNFYVKNDRGSSNADAFRAHSINELNNDMKEIVNKYLKNITNQQLKALMSNEKRVVIIGDYGGGKTLVLSFKAMDILIKIRKGEYFGRIRFMTKKIALEMDVIPRFREMFNEETLMKYVTFQSWEDFSENDSIPEEFCFFDEFDDTRNVTGVEDNFESGGKNFSAISRTNNKQKLNDISQQSTNTQIWVVIASTHEHKNFDKHCELKDFVFHDFSWQLRNSHCTTYISKMLMSGDDTDENVGVNYPIYGARSRIHSYEGINCTAKNINYCVNEVEYWLSQIKNGSILIYDNLVEYEIMKAQIGHKFNLNLEHLKEATSCYAENDTAQKIRMYFSSTYAPLSGLEFDIVIADTQQMFANWKILSRAKYGISWLYIVPDEEHKAIIKRLSTQWGRCSIINR